MPRHGNVMHMHVQGSHTGLPTAAMQDLQQPRLLPIRHEVQIHPYATARSGNSHGQFPDTRPAAVECLPAGYARSSYFTRPCSCYPSTETATYRHALSAGSSTSGKSSQNMNGYPYIGNDGFHACFGFMICDKSKHGLHCVHVPCAILYIQCHLGMDAIPETHRRWLSCCKEGQHCIAEGA